MPKSKRRLKRRKNLSKKITKGKRLKTVDQLSEVERNYGRGAYSKTDSNSRTIILNKHHQVIKILN